MKRKAPKSQSGFALLMFLLAMMTAGGFLLINFSQGMLESAEVNKFEHNKQVLEEAKRALLLSAYNYPVTDGLGPGRLPCADTDNDGTANCGSTFGRLPWNQPNLNFYDIRDADGERLWYAVSSSFRPQAAVINSGTPGTVYLSSGTITLRDQQGNVIYDGANAGGETQYGVAAVIIAPGAIIDRNGVSQDRSVANADDPFDTTADTDPGIISATNYLDLAFGEDNSSFINGSASDGFIHGPVYDASQNIYLTNDQFVVISAAEVVEMAEMAAMQAYAKAIGDYRINASYCEGESPDGATTEALCLAAATPGTWTIGPYPWLYNYEGVPDVDGLTDYFPVDADWATELATNLTSFGRIPARAPVDYFTESDSAPVSFETEVTGQVGFSLAEMVGCTGCPSTITWSVNQFKFYDFSTVKMPEFPDTQILTNAEFVDIADVVGNDGRLTGTSSAAVSGTIEMYFWDDDDYPVKIWTPCGDDGDGIPELTDCNRDWSGNPKPGGSNQEKSWILRMLIPTDTPFYNAGVVNIDMDYSTAPLIEIVPATDESHSVISATYTAASIINGTMPAISGTISWEMDEHYHVGEGAGDFDPSKGGNITSGVAVAGPLKLGIRYYPELPAWAFDNDWHNSMILQYAERYKPGGLQTCVVGSNSSSEGCLKINIADQSGSTYEEHENYVAILLNTGEHDWVDGTGKDGTGDSPGDSNFLTEREDWDRVLETGNRELDFILRWRWPGRPTSGTPRMVPPGNDNLLVLEEQ